MRISDWSSDVCSSDLHERQSQPAPNGWRHAESRPKGLHFHSLPRPLRGAPGCLAVQGGVSRNPNVPSRYHRVLRRAKGNGAAQARSAGRQNQEARKQKGRHPKRSEEHTSEIQSLMRISYAVFSSNNNTKLTTQ